MIENIKENSIVIVQDNYKTEFIRKFRKSKNLYDVKIIGLNEFKKKFYFDYTKETIFYVHKKYGVIKEIAEIYLENLYYLCEDNSKKMKIDPIPYLIMEFVTANTYSMLLVIGNPTNIYLTNFFHISFMEYISNMLIPTMVAGMVSLCLLLMLFYKKLKTPLKINYQEEIKIQHKGLLIVALIHLGICLFSLCIANLLKIEMYLLCLIVASSLCLILILVSLFTKKNHIKSCLLKLPYNLIPFLLSMFVLVLSLKEVNVFTSLATYYNKINNKYVLRYQYGFGSLFSANVLNNIPMTLAYSFIMENTNISSFSSTIYPCIVASNIGAYLTPIGSLAGIMWLDILKNKDIHYGFKEFIKYGFIFAPLTLFVTLLFF